MYTWFRLLYFLKKNNICSLQLKFMKVMIRFLPKFFKEIPVAKVSAIRLSCLQTPASFYVNSNFFFFLMVYITQLKRIYFFQVAQFWNVEVEDGFFNKKDKFWLSGMYGSGRIVHSSLS